MSEFVKMADDDFLIFLRMMSKKGFYETLKHVKKRRSIHYNEVLNYAIDNKIVSSKASITIILNGLTNLGLLERKVTDDRPIRTLYSLTKDGEKILSKLSELQKFFK